MTRTAVLVVCTLCVASGAWLADVSGQLATFTGGWPRGQPAQEHPAQALTLTAGERRDLIAFLESLTDEAALRDPRWSDPWK